MILCIFEWLIVGAIVGYFYNHDCEDNSSNSIGEIEQPCGKEPPNHDCEVDNDE